MCDSWFLSICVTYKFESPIIRYIRYIYICTYLPVGPRWAPCWPHEPCYQVRSSGCIWGKLTTTSCGILQLYGSHQINCLQVHQPPWVSLYQGTCTAVQTYVSQRPTIDGKGGVSILPGGTLESWLTLCNIYWNKESTQVITDCHVCFNPRVIRLCFP